MNANKRNDERSDGSNGGPPEGQVEAPGAVEAAGGGGEAGDSGEDPMGQLQSDLEKFRDLALRSQADLDNYRKRATREREDAVRYANAALIERLLPVLDNFQLGLEAARGSGEEAKPILEGMEMVLRQLEEVLRDSGVRRVGTEGAVFDPNVHEAVSQQPDDQVAEGRVIKELRPGYLLNDRLLRAANVVVSSGPGGGGGGV